MKFKVYDIPETAAYLVYERISWMNATKKFAIYSLPTNSTQALPTRGTTPQAAQELQVTDHRA